jgi:hypothetical protein
VGSQAVIETAGGSYNYGLSCTAQGITASAAVTVAMTVPTVTLSAAPSTVSLGKPVTLTWNSQNAASCTAGGGQGGSAWATAPATQGTATVTPTVSGTLTYNITCSSGPKSAEATATVSVADPPAPSSGGGGAFDAISLLGLLAMLGSKAQRGRQWQPSRLHRRLRSVPTRAPLP